MEDLEIVESPTMGTTITIVVECSENLVELGLIHGESLGNRRYIR